VQAKRGEDRLVIESHGGDFVVGVFDGHRGQEVAGFAAKAMPSMLLNHMMWPCEPEHALTSCFVQCHEAAREQGLCGGSTALLLASCEGALWCASAGDSRAVAKLRNGAVCRLSTDHTVHALPSEATRIVAAGGKIECGRLAGVLPMTRGFGNFDLESDGFTCVPSIACVPLASVEFLVAASDGLWDVVSDDDCCNLLAAASSCRQQSAAELLVYEAQRRGSPDDIAVVVMHVPQGTFPLDSTI